MNETLSMERVGLRREGSTFDPCLFFVYRKQGSAVGAFTTHIDDILGCGEPGAMESIRKISELRSGELKLQEGNSVHVGVELVQDSNCSATLIQEDFAKKLQPFGTSPQLWAARQKLLSTEDVQLCQCELGRQLHLARIFVRDWLALPLA